METIKGKGDPAYLLLEENALAFAEDGVVAFSVRPQAEALTPGNVFIVDIYAADDHSHPDGHAGWWECPLGGQALINVSVTRSGGLLSVLFNGEAPKIFWVNEAFEVQGRTLVLHLVIRAWRSTAILFNDPVNLYPDQAALERDGAAMPVCEVPADVPGRWFVWPPKTRVLLVFSSIRSAGICNFCDQLAALLKNNDIPFKIYAHVYSGDQRLRLKPTEYLCHEAAQDDLVFFVFAEGGSLLPLVAALPSKKILYHMHLPDYKRYQAFDAEYARSLAEVEEQWESLLAFDGICYESEVTQKSVCDTLKDKVADRLAEAWAADAPDTNGPAKKTAEFLYSLAAQSIPFSTKAALCAFSDDSPAYLPKRLCLTMLEPLLPPCLGVFPPVMWKRSWRDVQEETCHVPDPFILSLGSFRPDKHHEQTLKIFAAVAERHPTIGLVIAGWPSINGYWDYLQFLRENTYASIASRIVFLQGRTEGELLYLYRRARLFLSACSYEGYSKSILEALSFKLPVVARETMSIQEILGPSGLQFSHETPVQCIAEDILRLCADVDARKTVVENQGRFASWEPAAIASQKILQALYQTAAHNSSTEA